MHPPPPPLMQDSLLNAQLESKSSQTRQVLPGLLLCIGPVLRFPGGPDGRQIRLAELLEERRLRQITNPGFSSFSVSSLDSWQQACIVSLRGNPAWGCYGDMTLRLTELLGPRYRLANLSKGSALRCNLPYLHALFLQNFFSLDSFHGRLHPRQPKNRAPRTWGNRAAVGRNGNYFPRSWAWAIRGPRVGAEARNWTPAQEQPS